MKTTRSYEIKEGDTVYTLMEWLCSERIGIFITAIKTVSVYYKLNFFPFKGMRILKTHERNAHYFWKPAKATVDKKAFTYTEYGKKSDLFTNMWFEIKGNAFFQYLQEKWKLGIIFKGLTRGVVQCKQQEWLNILNKIEFDAIRTPF